MANSHGMTLVAHEPFESAEAAIRKESDIFSDSIIVETAPRRIRVADTDIGAELKESIVIWRSCLRPTGTVRL